jgi:hypothetical protein
VERHIGRIRGRLHELNPVALRVEHVEPVTAIGTVCHLPGDGDLPCCQVFAQDFRIRRDEGDMIEPVDRCRPAR